jgi:hypothetical protein
MSASWDANRVWRIVEPGGFPISQDEPEHPPHFHSDGAFCLIGGLQTQVMLRRGLKCRRMRRLAGIIAAKRLSDIDSGSADFQTPMGRAAFDTRPFRIFQPLVNHSGAPPKRGSSEPSWHNNPLFACRNRADATPVKLASQCERLVGHPHLDPDREMARHGSVQKDRVHGPDAKANHSSAYGVALGKSRQRGFQPDHRQMGPGQD